MMLGKWKLLFSSSSFSVKYSEFSACSSWFYRTLETIIIFLYGFADVEWLQCFTGNNINASSLGSAAGSPCSFNGGPLSNTHLKPSVTLPHTAFSAPFIMWVPRVISAPHTWGISIGLFGKSVGVHINACSLGFHLPQLCAVTDFFHHEVKESLRCIGLS